MKREENQNRIIITTGSDVGKQKLPLNLIFSLAAGAIAGVAIIFGLFWGADMLFGL